MKPFTVGEIKVAIEETLRRLEMDPTEPVWNEWACDLLEDLELRSSFCELEYFSAEDLREAAVESADSLVAKLKVCREASLSLLARNNGALSDEQREVLSRVLKETSDPHLKVPKLLRFVDLVVEKLEAR